MNYNDQIKVAFLDRDGTIVKEYDDLDWIGKTVPEFLDGSIEALKILRQNNYQIIIVSNQPLINKGIITEKDYKEFSDNLIKVLNENGIDILDIFYCPHTTEENCVCKKPNPGMILKAMEKYNIDMEKSFLCGDRKSDEKLADYFNIPFFGVMYEPENSKYKYVENLLDVINYLNL